MMHLLALTQNDVITPRYGGALRVSRLLDQLIRRGLRVSVIRFRRANERLSPTDARLPVRDVIIANDYGFPPLAALAHLTSRSAERLALAIHHEHPVDLVQSDPPWVALAGARVARRLSVPHALLAQNCETALAAQMSQTGPARRLPLVGRWLADFDVAVVRWAERRAMAGADLALTASPRDREEMASFGIPIDRVEIIPNGTSVQRPSTLARVEMRSQLGLAANAPTVIFVGRMDYPPNRHALHSICADIAPHCAECTFLLVGSNPPALSLPGNVKLIGAVDEVDGYLAASDLSIVPIAHASGTRIKILDAWAAGLPVLSTSAGASGLEYRDGEHLVIEDRIERFPDRIRELFQAPARLARLQAGALHAVAPYRWDTIGQHYADRLCALASSQGRRGRPQVTADGPWPDARITG